MCVIKRYRIDQPESAMHGWVINGTLSNLERLDIDYIAFTYDCIDYGVPLNWCVETDRAIPLLDADDQTEMAL